jgi:PAS domain S-box-containing protein
MKKQKKSKQVDGSTLRRQAEEQLRAENPDNGLSHIDTEQIRLLHELQVHQIELEMQNEELRRAQCEAEESWTKYADLYDFAPIGYLTLDEKGLISQLNLTAARLLGMEREFLVNKPFSFFLKPEYQDVFYFHKREVLASNTGKTCELVLKSKDGTLFDARLDSVSAEVEGNRMIRAALTDITERKRAEQNIRREVKWTNFLFALYEKAPQLTDKDLYDFVLEHAVKLTDSTIGFFHIVSADRKTITLTAWNKGALENCMAPRVTHYPIDQAGNWVDCVRLGRPVAYNDFPSSPNRRGLPEGHAPVRRFMSVPVIEEGKAGIIFGVGNKSEEYDDVDSVQLQLVAKTLQNVINLRLSDKALRTSEERYRSYIEVTGELGWTTNPEGKVFEDLPTWRRYTGQSEEEIMAAGWAKALHPDDVAHTSKAWNRALATKRSYEVEYRIRRHDGVYRYFFVRGVPDDSALRHKRQGEALLLEAPFLVAFQASEGSAHGHSLLHLRVPFSENIWKTYVSLRPKTELFQSEKVELELF